jgi:hypothetical protein
MPTTNPDRPRPSFDASGYPTDPTIAAIERWDASDLDGLLAYLKEAWHDHGRIHEENGLVTMSTGGWSGNEEIADALSNNQVFWALCWESSRRGGHSVFRFRQP